MFLSVSNKMAVALLLTAMGFSCSSPKADFKHDEFLQSFSKHLTVNSISIFRPWDIHEVGNPPMNPIFINTFLDSYSSDVFDKYIDYLNVNNVYQFRCAELQPTIDSSKFMGFRYYYNLIKPRRLSERHLDSLAVSSGVDLKVPRYVAITNLKMDMKANLGVAEVKELGHSGRVVLYFFYYDDNEMVVLEAIDSREFLRRLNSRDTFEKY